MKPFDFNNKTVVVTGAASGIGLALSKAFADGGASVALLDVDENGAREQARRLTERGSTAAGFGCDVASEPECLAAIRSVTERFGGIDVLVNNAGITQRSAFMDTGIDVFRRVMDINFFGSLYCTRAAIDSIVARKGMIIVIESLAGVSPLLGRSGYCASKHALHGLFTTLRTEIRPAGAHVMIACPGFIRTNLQTRALGGDGRVTDHPQSTVGRPDTPENAARIICKSARKRKNMVVLTTMGKIGYLVSRLAPNRYERIMARQFAAELVRKG